MSLSSNSLSVCLSVFSNLSETVYSAHRPAHKLEDPGSWRRSAKLRSYEMSFAHLGEKLGAAARPASPATETAARSTIAAAVRSRRARAQGCAAVNAAAFRWRHLRHPLARLLRPCRCCTRRATIASDAAEGDAAPLLSHEQKLDARTLEGTVPSKDARSDPRVPTVPGGSDLYLSIMHRAENLRLEQAASAIAAARRGLLGRRTVHRVGARGRGVRPSCCGVSASR